MDISTPVRNLICLNWCTRFMHLFIIRWNMTFVFFGAKEGNLSSKIELTALYCVDLEVWSKLAKCVRIMRIASKYTRDFDSDLQRACKHVLLRYCETRSTSANYLWLRYKNAGSCCYGMSACKCDSCIRVDILLHTSRSTEYTCTYVPISLCRLTLLKNNQTEYVMSRIKFYEYMIPPKSVRYICK